MNLENLLKLSIINQIKIQYHYDKILNDLRNHFLRGVDSTICDCIIPHSNFPTWIEENFDLDELDKNYIPLLDSFLNEYALNKTEKSE